MKKLFVLLLILGVANLASAALVGLGAPAAGEPGSAEAPLAPGDTVVIPVTNSGNGLLTLDAIISATSGSIAAGDTVSLGWDAGLSFDPVVKDAQTIELGLGNFNGNTNDVVATIIFTAGEESAQISITPATDLGGSANLDDFAVPEFGGPIDINVIPEPMTLSLLGLGGLALIRRRRA